MKSPLLHRITTAALGLSLAAGATLAAAPSALAATASDIARVANQEAAQPHTCSYYGNCPGAGWCAVFATWIWQHAGVSDLGGLNISAVDFYRYGVNKHTVDQVPNVGDAVVYNLNGTGTYADHVNIVVAVSGDTVTTVGGNESNTVQRTSWNWKNGYNASGQRASAYIAPAGLSTPVAPSGSSNGRAVQYGQTLEEFERTPDDRLRHTWWPDGGAPQSAVMSETPAGSIRSTPAVTTYNGQLQVFARGQNDKLAHVWYSGDTWRSEQFSSDVAGRPGVAVYNNELHVFYRDTAGYLKHLRWDGSWHSESLWSNQRLAGDPTVTVFRGQLQVFARTADSQLFNTWWGAAGWGTTIVPGSSLIAGDPAAMVYSDQLQVWSRGVNGRLEHSWYTDRWNNETQYDWPTVAGDPALTEFRGELQVFAQSGGGLFNAWWHDAWGTTTIPGISASGNPTATAYNDILEVFVRGADGALQHAWYTAGWQTESLGGPIS